MKRTRIEIQDVASFSNLSEAAAKAAKGKRLRPEVKNFFRNYEKNLILLRNDILNGKVPAGKLNKFTIFDPKERIIHAPCFRDRVFHHSLMNYVGPVLDQSMVDFSFACRPGKGVHAGVRQVQSNISRFLWYVKIDIKSYFDSIDHHLLMEMLKRRLKGDEIMGLIEKIISSYSTIPGKGLPIGALPSQHLANFYLDCLDRYIMEELRARACVRYMDDILWWIDSRKEAKFTLAQVIEYVKGRLLLKVKMPVVQINKSKKGVAFCGFYVLPGKIKLSARRQRRYIALRNKWENAYKLGLINERTLQSAYSSVYAITSHTDSREWRKKQLALRESPDC